LKTTGHIPRVKIEVKV